MTIYFFSGLGADERVFQKIILPKEWKIVLVKWIEHLPQETLAGYCKRISQQIDAAGIFSFVGLSFGGLVAVEIAKYRVPEHLILISSISNKSERPFFHRIAMILPLHKLIPGNLLKRAGLLSYWAFGVHSREERELLKAILRDTLPVFTKWAIDKIINWSNEARPVNLFHIHGMVDRLFPIRGVQADISIEEGGHFMIYNKAAAISSLIKQRITGG